MRHDADAHAHFPSVSGNTHTLKHSQQGAKDTSKKAVNMRFTWNMSVTLSARRRKWAGKYLKQSNRSQNFRRVVVSQCRILSMMIFRTGKCTWNIQYETDGISALTIFHERHEQPHQIADSLGRISADETSRNKKKFVQRPHLYVEYAFATTCSRCLICAQLAIAHSHSQHSPCHRELYAICFAYAYVLCAIPIDHICYTRVRVRSLRICERPARISVNLIVTHFSYTQ